MHPRRAPSRVGDAPAATTRSTRKAKLTPKAQQAADQAKAAAASAAAPPPPKRPRGRPRSVKPPPPYEVTPPIALDPVVHEPFFVTKKAAKVVGFEMRDEEEDAESKSGDGEGEESTDGEGESTDSGKKKAKNVASKVRAPSCLFFLLNFITLQRQKRHQ